MSTDGVDDRSRVATVWAARTAASMGAVMLVAWLVLRSGRPAAPRAEETPPLRLVQHAVERGSGRHRLAVEMSAATTAVLVQDPASPLRRRLASQDRSELHVFELDGLDAIADRPSIVLAPGVAARLTLEGTGSLSRRLEQRLRAFDTAVCVGAIRAARASDGLPDEPAWALRRQLEPFIKELPLLKWLLPRALGAAADPARAAAVYALASRWLALDAACEALGIAHRSGVAESLPACCRPGTSPPFERARRLRLPVARPAVRLTVFGVPDALSGESLGLGKTVEEVQIQLEPDMLARSRAAAIWLPLDAVDAKSHQDNHFAVSVNDRISLFLRYARADFATAKLPGLYHTFDPGLLGRDNRLRVTMPSLPGLDSRMGEVYFEFIELWLDVR